MAPKKVIKQVTKPEKAKTEKAPVKPVAPVVPVPDEEKLDKKHTSAFIMHMRAAAKAGNTVKAAILKRYEELPHRSEEKQEMIKKHMGDKTGSWYTTIEQVQTQSEELAHNFKNGYGSKFDVAKACGIPLTPEFKPVLDSILAKLPSDDKWDETIPLEAGFKDAKEPRYYMTKADFDTLTKKDTKEDKNLTSHEFKLKAGELPPALTNGENVVKIKLEFPEHVELVEKLKILDSAEPKLTKQLDQLRKCTHQLKVMNSTEADGKRAEALQDIKVLEGHLDNLLETSCQCRLIQKEDKAALIDAATKVRDLIKTLGFAEDAAKTKVKKFKAIVENL
jgi:hypothetical protein